MGLKELRLKRGMTQRELAQRSGVHPLRLRRSKRVNATSGRCRLILHCDCVTLCAWLLHVSCLILIPRLRRIECNPPGLDVSL